jgi:hypothetical protein
MENSIRTELLLACARRNIELIELPPYESSLVRQEIIDTFAAGRVGLFIWEHFGESYSVRDPAAPLWVGEFIGQNQAVLCFSEAEDTYAFGFGDGQAVVEVLEQYRGFEFYLTNSDFEYVLCFNLHGYLIAAGTAIAWLKARAPRRD